MSAGACAGCGAPLAPSRGGPPRKWCSERCRKRTLYAGVCERCGRPTNCSDGRAAAPRRCAGCARAERHERALRRLIAEVHRWHDLYGEIPAASAWNLASVRARRRAYAEGRANGRHAEAYLAEMERRHREDGPWPSTSGVLAVAGSWNRLIALAGFTPRRSCDPRAVALR